MHVLLPMFENYYILNSNMILALFFINDIIVDHTECYTIISLIDVVK